MLGRTVESRSNERSGEAGAALGAASSGRDIASGVLALQRKAGNRATLGALKLATPPRAVGLEVP